MSMARISPLILILIHSALISCATILIVFYLFPHDFYFATPLYLITPILFFVTNYLIPAGTRLLPFKDIYLTALVSRPGVSWCITTAIIALSFFWALAMFNTVYDRYVFLKSLDGALSSIGVDGMALPEPGQLAKAFNAAPDRPEVPFILTRASRLLASDFLTPIFGTYNKAFLKGVDRDALLKNFAKYESKNRIAIGNESSNLPRLDPIRFLTNVAFETNDSSDQQWALKTLVDLRKDDAGARVQIEIWKSALAEPNESSPEMKIVSLEQSIDAIEELIEPSALTQFSDISFLSDNIFQQGLDFVATAKIELQSYGSNDTDKCRYNDEIIRDYERIMILRRRLSSATDLMWWEPPGKMFLYYLYLYLGHQTTNIGLDTVKMIEACPTLMARLQRMYDAPPFRSFQNPDYWFQGTPLSAAFAGAASVRQLREWLKLGW